MTTRKSASRRAGKPAVEATDVPTLDQVQQLIAAVGSGGGGTPTWTYGAFPNAVPAYKSKAEQAATSGPVKLMVLSDSTSDGFVGGGVNGGSSTWDHVWPQLLMTKLRAQQALPSGGDGWIPPSPPTWPGGYDYDTSIRRPTAYTEMDELNFQIGIPGSLWLQAGHATNVYDVEYLLSPGTTSVDLVTTGYGGNIIVTCGNTAANTSFDSAGDRKFTRITNPGASVRLTGASGVGFAMLGIFEYVGDEAKGFRMMNFAQASIQAGEVHSWLGDSSMSMKPMIAAYQPDVCLVVLGSNDLSNTQKTVTEIMNHLGGVASEVNSAAPGCKVVFVQRPNPDPRFTELTNMLIANASQVNAEVLDLRNEPRVSMSNSSLYVADGVHFTSAGDEAMASVLADYLKVEKSTGSGSGLTETQVRALADEQVAANNTAKPRRWASEVIINSGALVDGYNDNIGGVLVDNDITLTQASFRIADPAATIGGTGNLQIQWYAGSPTALETTLITTTQLAAGQHDVIVTLATPLALTINTVLRAKITLGTTTVALPCHVQWRGRYT